jgi:peptidoglycan/LPS O-acetylase OafA/YrhL
MSATLTPARPAPEAAPSAPSLAPATKRDPWFDNAKMLLVTLVVVGHSWSLLAESFSTTWAYNFLYLWHVPAFVMVTGYLSRSFTSAAATCPGCSAPWCCPTSSSRRC